MNAAGFAGSRGASRSLARRALLLPRGALLLACSAAWLACGDAASTPAESEQPVPTVQEPASTTQPDPAAALPANGEAQLQLSIEGWQGEIVAKAQLDVAEGKRAVTLEITGGGNQDILLLNIDFDGVEGTMGHHNVDVSMPGGGPDSATASIGGQPYQSQAGQVDVTLAPDGSISGSFHISLAVNPDAVDGQLSDAPPSGEVRDLDGQFNGHWKLFCQSHLPGHMSLIPGGQYCNGLQF